MSVAWFMINYISKAKEGSEHIPHSVENTENFQFNMFPAQAAKDTFSPEMTILQYFDDSDYSLACLSKQWQAQTFSVFIKHNTLFPYSGAVEYLFSFEGMIHSPTGRICLMDYTGQQQI